MADTNWYVVSDNHHGISIFENKRSASLHFAARIDLLEDLGNKVSGRGYGRTYAKSDANYSSSLIMYPIPATEVEEFAAEQRKVWGPFGVEVITDIWKALAA